MKKFKNKSLVIVLVLLLVISIGLYLVFNKKEEPVIPLIPENTLVVNESQSLDSPRNLSIVNNILTWKEVENATSYLVTINGREYLANSNMFNLLDIEEAIGYVKIKALASNNNLSSFNSIERYYIKEFDEVTLQKLILKVKELLIKTYNLEIDGHLDNVIEQIANELYFEGVNDALYEEYYSKVNELISNFEQDELDSSKIINDLYCIFDNEMSDYANVLMLKNIVILNIESYKKINAFDKRFDLLIEELDKLTSNDIETISLTVRYLRDLSSIILEQGSTIIDQFKLAIENDVKSKNSVSLGYDMIVLKNQLTSNFILEIPVVEDYEFAIDVLSNLYDSILPDDLKEYNLVELFKSEFYKFYLEQHKNIYYLDYIDASHYEKLISICKNLFDAFGGQKFEDNILELETFYHNGEYEAFLENLLKYGLTSDGKLDQIAYDRAFEGLKQLNIDLQNEDYQYIEGPLTTFFTEVFNYFKVEHSANIIVNPLIKYLKAGGSFREHFIAQFNLLNYIKIAEDKTYIDILKVVKEWDEEDWELINNFDGNLTEFVDVVNILGLQEIIIIDSETLNDLLEMRFLIHLVEFLNELSLKESITDKITLLFEHYNIFTKIIPLVNNLLVDLDYRYGTNIDLMNFILNMFVNMGANSTMVALNLSELSNFMNSLQNSFDSTYTIPDLEITDIDSELIKTAIKENLVYLIFGNDVNNILDIIIKENSDFAYLIELLERLRNEDEKDNPTFDEILDIVLKDQNIEDFEVFNGLLNIPDLEDIIDSFINNENSNGYESLDKILNNFNIDDLFILLNQREDNKDKKEND